MFFVFNIIVINCFIIKKNFIYKNIDKTWTIFMITFIAQLITQ